MTFMLLALLPLWVRDPAWGQEAEGSLKHRSELVARIIEIDGSATITSTDGARAAESFAELFPGDTLTVKEGWLTYLDLQDMVTQKCTAGSQQIIVWHEPSSLPTFPKKLLDYVLGISKMPERTEDVGAVRGPSLFPDRVEFAPISPIVFRWSQQIAAGELVLTNDAGRRWSFAHPSSPFAWPLEVTRLPGQYKWGLNGSGRQLARGVFRVLTVKEVDDRKAEYMKEAKQQFPETNVSLETLTVIVAGRHGCFLY